MSGNAGLKLLFVINPGAGANDISWRDIISNYFTGKNFITGFYQLEQKPDVEKLRKHISESKPGRVIAVGGDGTVTLVAKIIAGTNIPLGILPAGSANGMAKELKIPFVREDALLLIEKGIIKRADVIKINGKDICLHLADIGLNAQLIKYFDEGKLRGKLGYAKVILKTLWRKRKMQVVIQSKTGTIKTEAFMVVLANASMYGTGAVINPEGLIDDGAFEIVIIRKLAFGDLLKMLFRPRPFNPKNIETFHATSVKIETRHRVHFQIDGEYMGRITKLEAEIVPGYINLVLGKEA